MSTHNASIAGHRSGSAVSFVKRYEPPGYGYDTVAYEGSVNADATEIDGRWRLPGTTLSGTFLMVRSTKTAQSVATEERMKEPVRIRLSLLVDGVSKAQSIRARNRSSVPMTRRIRVTLRDLT